MQEIQQGSGIYIHNFSDSVAFRVISDKLNYHSCATSKRYSFSTKNSQGKNLLSSILLAKALKQTVLVVGSNKCDLHTSSEDVSWILIE